MLIVKIKQLRYIQSTKHKILTRKGEPENFWKVFSPPLKKIENDLVFPTDAFSKGLAPKTFLVVASFMYLFCILLGLR
jgi:hypothetical protein